MPTVANYHPFREGRWEATAGKATTGTPYAHLTWFDDEHVARVTINAMSGPEVEDLLEACRVASELLRGLEGR